MGVKAIVCTNCGHDELKCTPEETLRRAKQIIVFKKHASAAMLQQDLKISYLKAMEALDKLEATDFIGPADGSKPRVVYG